VRFGIFDADLSAGELRRSGSRVQLQQQPFQVLAALLARPGELIPRDELQNKIWPGDTFIDSERGINKAISRLRDALGDSAESPRFIETLPRRGYRFIAPIERAISSVAVLPIENLSGDPNQDYWADGITDELVTQIAKISGIRVIARTSVMRFKGSGIPLPEIAEKLGIEAVIQGSLVVSAQRIRIRVQLVDADTDRHLWTEAYERDVADVITLQQEIAQAIAQKFQVHLAPDELDAERASRVRPDAYEAYLKGRFFWNKRTEPDLNSAMDYFNRAVVLDPRYAHAHVGLADCYTLLGVLGSTPPRSAFPRAKAAAETALQFDNTLVEAYATRGHIRTIYDCDWRGAEQDLTRAIELNPNYSVAHQFYGILLTILRHNREAIKHLKIARDLDPLSLPINALLGFTYMRARQYDSAIQACESAIELDPSNAFGHWILSRMLDADKNLGQALAEAEMAVRLSKDSVLFRAHLGYAYARIRDEARAHQIVEELLSASTKHYVSPYLIAVIYVGLEWKDLALEWLEKAYADRAPRLNELIDPPFDYLRSDLRFQSLAERLGFPTA
jgi:TolB-like protein/Tfp pilus assembly protein PilF